MQLGSVADWVMCVVSLASAGAVIYLGHEANKLGKAANGIADNATRLAREAETREAAILLMYLEADLRNSLQRARELVDQLSTPLSDAIFATDSSYRERVDVWLAGLEIPALLANLDRLHVLGDLANRLVIGTGMLKTAVRFATKAADPRREEGDRFEDHRAICQYIGWYAEQIAPVATAATDAKARV